MIMKKAVCYLPRLILTASVIITTGAISLAQTNTGKSTTGSASMSDTAFISKNIMDNMMEIQMSQMGITKATDPNVKSLAQQMVSDHTQILTDLQRIARTKNMSTMNMSAGNWGTGSGSTGSGVGT